MHKLGVMGILAVMILCFGCSGSKDTDASAAPKPKPGQSSYSGNPPVMAPGTQLSGTVAKVNTGGQFVVITFPIGRLPTMDQKMSVYRRGVKMGEISITGPQLDDTVVGDLVAGTAEIGDEVR
jgi:hypothetical protein